MMDHILEQAVLSALHLEPSIDVSRILARVRNGVATLTGDVDTHGRSERMIRCQAISAILGLGISMIVR